MRLIPAISYLLHLEQGRQLGPGHLSSLEIHLRFTSAGYAGNGGSDAIVGQFNQRIKQVANDLYSDGLHIVEVDASGYYAPNGTNTQGDGVHPTDAGHLVIAQAFLNEMSGLLLPKDRAALQIWQNLNPCTLNGSFGIGGCAPNFGRGDIFAARSATSGAFGLGLDGSGMVRTGQNYLWSAVPSLNLFQFNGTTSAFPALKMFGTPAKIAVRASDDSADASFEALSVAMPEGSAVTAATGIDVCYGDSTAHA